jgi:Phage tail tube protein
MSSANRVQIAGVLETTLGATPTTPRMRADRYLQESLEFKPEFLDSDEIRADRMLGDPIKVMQASAGSINSEFSYPVDNTMMSTRLMSAFCAPWVNTPNRDNDGTADSVVTDVNAGTSVVTITTGAAFVASQLVQFSGFALAANNGIFKCTAGSATVPAFVGAGLAVDATPAAAARMKVVGAVGVAGDITATATGLASTALNFTTLGLSLGQWIKIGGTAAGDQFANSFNNNYARITAIAAAALTLDNLPTGWAVDAGAAKTIKIWFGDMIKNGTTIYGHTLEKGFLDHSPPSYLTYKGQVVNTMDFTLTSRQKITWSCSYMGMGGSAGTVTLDAVIDPATTNQIMAGNASVGRLAEAGTTLAGPNWAKEFSIQINNNLRAIDAIDSVSPVDIQFGDCTVTGKLMAYFGSLFLLNKFYAGTPTSLNSRIFKNSQAVIIDVPRATYRGGGSPAVSGKNTDVNLSLDYQASYDQLTGAHLTMNRMEYVESLN